MLIMIIMFHLITCPAPVAWNWMWPQTLGIWTWRNWELFEEIGYYLKKLGTFGRDSNYWNFIIEQTRVSWMDGKYRNWRKITFRNWLIRMLLFFLEPCKTGIKCQTVMILKKITLPSHQCSSSWWCWSPGCRPRRWGRWCLWSWSCSCTSPAPPWRRLCQLKICLEENCTQMGELLRVNIFCQVLLGSCIGWLHNLSLRSTKR